MSEPLRLAAIDPGQVDLPVLRNEFSRRHKVARGLWEIVWVLLFRPSPRVFHGWRRLILAAFGARLGAGVRVDPSARIWAPWNLTMGDQSCLGPDVDCYCVGPISVGRRAVVSQHSHLCAASHDHELPDFPLITAPIRIGAGAWVAAGAFIGMGVTIGEGAVVGARASVFRDVDPWTVVGGNPARFIKPRRLRAA